MATERLPASVNDRTEIFAIRAVVELMIRNLAQSNPGIVSELRNMLTQRESFRPGTEHLPTHIPANEAVKVRAEELLADAARA
jgi:hypothetical protein